MNDPSQHQRSHCTGSVNISERWYHGMFLRCWCGPWNFIHRFSLSVVGKYRKQDL